MRYLLLFLFIVAAFWIGISAVQHSSDITINYQWNDNPMSVSLTSTTLLIVGILGALGLYIFFTVLKFIFGLKKRLRNRRQAKLSLKAKHELTRGLVQFTEGRWEESEHTLLNNVVYSETPLLNYLAASRSAHMQEAYDRRDSYLKTASEQGDDAQVAVAVSQSEMQFSSNQLEQSRATLIRLLEASPKHPYALKLLAKVYYQQEDWNNLFTLLPDLDNLSLIKDKDNRKYQKTALTGIFHSLARKKDSKSLYALWKKLPVNLHENSEFLLLYCEALSEAGDSEQSNKLLIENINKKPDEKLFERYGLIDHQNLGDAIKDAEQWLINANKSPMLLLALARLNRNYQLWGKSKSFYNASLNFSPSSAVYLEFSELLEELSEHENAQQCHKQGLKYSIHKKGEILTLKGLRTVENTRPRLKG
ncbi:MAG: heme biosynthesis HemY N-terminal domain-containing protein [Cocleimonas sp.]